MYENEIEKSSEGSVESDAAGSGDSGGIYDSSVSDNRGFSLLESSEDDGYTAVSSDSEWESSFSEDGCVSLSDSVSSGDSAGSDSSTLQDYSSYLDALQDEISEVNNLVLLIFLFLILSWTENKISLALSGIRERKR